MPAPPAYLDECVDRPVAEDLRRRGFDVLTAIESGRAGYPDRAQLEYATSQGRVILSYDRLDFRRLHTTFLQTGRPHRGNIILPQTRIIRRRQIRAALLLEWFGIVASERSHLMVWNHLQQQLLRSNRIPGYSEDEVRVALGER
jgi:hypothetical protein